MKLKIRNIINRLNRRDLTPTLKIPKFFKFTLILIIIVSTFFLVKNNFTKAEEVSIYTEQGIENHPVLTEQNNRENGNNLSSWTNSSLAANAGAGLEATSGKFETDKLGKISWVPGGMIGQTTKYIGYLYNAPASGTLYIADNVNNFIGKPAYAQSGIGYTGLQPLLPIWKIFRDIIYIIISLVFVVIGLLIMLRVKISPQAVITIQSAIPKLISSLILVTFSYAIAGLLIDLSYVLPGLIITLFLKSPAINAIYQAMLSNQIEALKLFFTNLTDINATVLNNDFLNGAINPNPYILFAYVGQMAPMANVMGVLVLLGLALTPTMGISVILGVVAAILAPLILSIMILIWMIKFFVGLLKCYFNVILKIILAPLEIGLGAIPNMKLGFGSWFIGLVANLIVFPACTLFILLVVIVVHTIPNLGLWAPDLIQLTDASFIAKTCIGLGALMLLPKLPKLIPEAIFQLKPSPFGTAIGESAKPLGNFGKGIGNTVVSGARGGIGDAIGNRVAGSNSRLGNWISGGRPPVGGGNPPAGGGNPGPHTP